MQVKCHVYLLPKFTTPVHLIRCQRRPAIAISFAGAKPALSCVVGSAFDPRMAGRSSARVVTRTSDDGGRAFLPTPKMAVELVFSVAAQDDRYACGAGDCHRL